jgi:selenoprotein W-related protein
LTEKLLVAMKQDVEKLELIPSKGGCFEVWVDGKQLYSKLETGEFPDEKSIVAQVRARA